MHLLSEILGLQSIKKYLQKTIASGKIPHAQIFVGPSGSGTLPLAIAYSQAILSLQSSKNVLSKDFNTSNSSKVLAHPDLHFVYPVATNEKVKRHPTSDLFVAEWNAFVNQQSYGNVFDWYQHIGIQNKQGQIGVDEAANIVKKLRLKSYFGGYKILIIWVADAINIAAANKLLKLIEEPPEQTLFLLLTEKIESILPTIQSRCQVLHIPKLTESEIKEALIDQQKIAPSIAQNISIQAQGDYRKALLLIAKESYEDRFEAWFITWMRTAFSAKGNKASVHKLIQWSMDIAGSGREIQKQFLIYCISFFRQALLWNYGAKSLVYLTPKTKSFKLENFAPFIHGANSIAIFDTLQKAIFDIERNGNSKIIFTDLSMQLTRLLHQKYPTVSNPR